MHFHITKHNSSSKNQFFPFRSLRGKFGTSHKIDHGHHMVTIYINLPLFFFCGFTSTSTVNSYGHVRTVSKIATLFLGRLRHPKQLGSTKCTCFHLQLTTALLGSVEGETKVCVPTGYRTRELWLLSLKRY